METILGLAMIYAWIHGIVIVFKHVKSTTTYEKVVLWAGLVGFALYLIGTM
jgi:multisubunit Na+/H+ antiporter MnhF subunit